MRDVFAAKMLRQRLAPWPRRWRSLRTNRIGDGLSRGLCGLQLFQFLFEVLKLDNDLLALPAEERVAQLLDDLLQMLDLFPARVQLIALFGELQPLRGKLGLQSGQFRLLLSQGIALLRLVRCLPHKTLQSACCVTR